MAIKILKDFRAKLASIEVIRARIESLYSIRRIRRSDVDAIYESLFLKSVIGFERYCEELFFGILQRDIRHFHRSELMAGIRFSSAEGIRELLLAGQRQRYFTWIPFDDTIRRAKIYLEDGKPFTNLDKADKASIESIVKIRNAIAHESLHAMAELKNVFEANPHSQRDRTPAGFLRYQFRTSPDQNHFQGYLGSLGAIATKLSG